MRLVQPPGRIAGGRILFKGRDLLDARRAGDARGARRRDLADLPGADDGAQPGLPVGDQIAETLLVHGRATRREAQAQGDRAARRRAHSRPRLARQRLSAPAVRRHAPARADRHGARLPAVARHRRRADDGARRHDSGGDPRSAARDEGGVQPVAAAHHARPRRHRRNGRPRRRHVRRPHRRDRAGARDLPQAAASLHARPARVDARRRARPAAARDRGIGAAARRAAARLRVQPALPRSLRAVHDRAAAGLHRRTLEQTAKCYLHDPQLAAHNRPHPPSRNSDAAR